MSQHTPGPWSCQSAVYSELGEWSVDNPVRRVALVNDGAHNVEANARLIAAAPEMLEFVRMFADETETSKSLKAMDQARALLAKVEGVSL